MAGRGHYKPRPLVRPPKKERVYCIGYYCRGQKTFMSPNKKRIRQCTKCQAYADAHPEERPGAVEAI